MPGPAKMQNNEIFLKNNDPGIEYNYKNANQVTKNLKRKHSHINIKTCKKKYSHESKFRIATEANSSNNNMKSQ